MSRHQQGLALRLVLLSNARVEPTAGGTQAVTMAMAEHYRIQQNSPWFLPGHTLRRAKHATMSILAVLIVKFVRSREFAAMVTAERHGIAQEHNIAQSCIRLESRRTTAKYNSW